MIEDLNDLLDDAKGLPEQEEFTKLPDGEYNAVIHAVEFTTSKSGNYMFKWEFIVTDGKYAKSHEWKYQVLNKPENMKRLTTDLSKFGVNTRSIEKIQGDLETLLDVPVLITIKSSENKQNPEEPYRNISVAPLK